MEWAVRLRLHLEPQHLAAVELAERRDPFALGKRLGREPELRRLVHRLAPGPQVCSRRRTSEKLYIPEYFVFDQAALRFRPRNLASTHLVFRDCAAGGSPDACRSTVRADGRFARSCLASGPIGSRGALLRRGCGRRRAGADGGAGRHPRARQCRGHRIFRGASARFGAARHRSRRQDLHRSQGPLAPGHRPAEHGRPAAGATGAGAEAVYGDGRADRPGLRGRARRREPAEHLRRRDFGLRPADHGRARPGDRRRAGRDLHARIVRPAARRPGIDLEDRPADRRRLAVRQCNLQRRRQSRPGARRACLRSGIEEPVRRRPRHRHDPSLRARWDRARRLRPRRSGSSGGRIAGGRLRSGEAPRHHQPAVQHRGLEDLGLCAGRAARVRPRGAGRPALLRGQGSIADLVGVDCGRRVRRGCAHRDQCPAGRRRHRDVENPVRRSGTHGARRASGAVRRLRLRGAHPGGNCATATAASRSATTTRRTD